MANSICEWHCCSAVLVLTGTMASAVSADLFTVEMEFETEFITDGFSLSATMNGTDDWDPDEGWENFHIDDSGPWSLDSSFLYSIQGGAFYQAYGPTFGWGGITLDITDEVFQQTYADVELAWTITGPEWNHDWIGGTGMGSFMIDDTMYELEITSWTIALVPAPGGLIALLAAPCALRRRRA